MITPGILWGAGIGPASVVCKAIPLPSPLNYHSGPRNFSNVKLLDEISRIYKQLYITNCILQWDPNFPLVFTEEPWLTILLLVCSCVYWYTTTHNTRAPTSFHQCPRDFNPIPAPPLCSGISSSVDQTLQICGLWSLVAPSLSLTPIPPLPSSLLPLSLAPQSLTLNIPLHFFWNFQVFLVSSHFCFWLISIFKVSWTWENRWFDFYFLDFVEICLGTWPGVCFGECLLGNREECVPHFWGTERGSNFEYGLSC